MHGVLCRGVCAMRMGQEGGARTVRALEERGSACFHGFCQLGEILMMEAWCRAEPRRCDVAGSRQLGW